MRTNIPVSQRVLLEEAIDYAGLFPPAALGMTDAVRNYLEYLHAADSWALGRFVVPGSRLDEMREAISRLPAVPSHTRWRLSVLSSGAPAAEAEALRAVRSPDLVVDAVEVKAANRDEILALEPLAVRDWTLFVELPLIGDLGSMVEQLRAFGAMAKFRTGGVVSTAIPSAGDLAHGIATCARAGVGFKATAGLHHAIRADYPLTYHVDSAVGAMYGYVNVLLAAALARAVTDDARIEELLSERDAGAIAFDDSGVRWRDCYWSVGDLREVRAHLMRGFGSCSFREPVDELAEFGSASSRA